MKFGLMFCTAVFSLLAATSLQAAPTPVPTGLQPGDQYRLAFVTSGVRDATSPFISDYNDFVQDHADAVPELRKLGVSWNAIASTFFVDACENTGTCMGIDLGVPIFRVDDTQLVANNIELWMSRLHVALSVDETGVPALPDGVWTGTTEGGRASSWPLSDISPTFGFPYTFHSDWIDAAETRDTFLSPLYGLSEILTVAPVPEPSTFLLLSVAGMGAIVGYPSRARRRHHNKAAHS
jgi:hypothetical protein